MVGRRRPDHRHTRRVGSGRRVGGELLNAARVFGLEPVRINIFWSGAGTASLVGSLTTVSSVAGVDISSGGVATTRLIVSVRLIQVEPGRVLIVLDYQEVDSAGRVILAGSPVFKVARREQPGILSDNTTANTSPSPQPTREELREHGDFIFITSAGSVSPGSAGIWVSYEFWTYTWDVATLTLTATRHRGRNWVPADSGGTIIGVN